MATSPPRLARVTCWSPLLFTLSLRGALPLERAPRLVLFEGLRDANLLRFAAVAFIFPFSMGLVVSATPLFAADAGIGEGYIGLVLGANSILVAVLALPVAARIEAQGPLRFLAAAALLVAATHACYAAIPGVAAALLIGTMVFSFAEVIFSSAVPATVARLAPAGAARRVSRQLGAGFLAQHGKRALLQRRAARRPGVAGGVGDLRRHRADRGLFPHGDLKTAARRIGRIPNPGCRRPNR